MKIGQKEVKIDKIRIVIYLLTVWFVLSLGYLGWQYVAGRSQGAFLRGYEWAIREMVAEAKNEECRPFSIFAGEERVELINIECLQVEEDFQDFED